MVERLFAPYNEPRNRADFVAALKNLFSEEEAIVWCAYPEYTIDAVGKTPAEIAQKLPEGLRDRAAELSASLAEKGFLYPASAASGASGYVTTYLLDILMTQIGAVGDTTGLAKACEQYWADLMAGDTAHLRRTITEHRVLPHEGTLTGDAAYGHVPMNLEIPDARTVLPFDCLTEMLRRCRRFAVLPCLCRVATEKAGTRQCDFPIDDVCIVFDQAADAAIACGAGKEASEEEILKTVRRCRDLGMSQVISNAEHPLAMCNCCACCCLCLRSLRRFEDVVCTLSRFVADPVHREACVGCGKCEKVCPMGAVSFNESGVQVRAQQCAGCGECVALCPKGVLKLSPRPGAPKELPRETLDRIYI